MRRVSKVGHFSEDIQSAEDFVHDFKSGFHRLPAAQRAALRCTDSIAVMFLVVCGFHTCAAYSKTGRMDDLYTNDLTKEEQPQSEWRNKFNRLVALATVIRTWSVQFSVEFM